MEALCGYRSGIFMANTIEQFNSSKSTWSCCSFRIDFLAVLDKLAEEAASSKLWKQNFAILYYGSCYSAA